MREQLESAIVEAFENGRDPFSTEFLREHNVTADECVQISSLIATVLQAYFSLRHFEKMDFLARGVKKYIETQRTAGHKD